MIPKITLHTSSDFSCSAFCWVAASSPVHLLIFFFSSMFECFCLGLTSNLDFTSDQECQEPEIQKKSNFYFLVWLLRANCQACFKTVRRSRQRYSSECRNDCCCGRILSCCGRRGGGSVTKERTEMSLKCHLRENQRWLYVKYRVIWCLQNELTFHIRWGWFSWCMLVFHFSFFFFLPLRR